MRRAQQARARRVRHAQLLLEQHEEAVVAQVRLVHDGLLLAVRVRREQHVRAGREVGHRADEQVRVASLDGRLTERETEVLTLISKGLRNAEVASALNIAETTVAGYIKIVYRKLGISSRAEAAWHANRLGLGLKPE